MLVNQPLTLPSGVVLDNRLICAPISTLDSMPSGNVSELEYDFFKERAGDVGAIVVASAYVSYDGKAYEHGVGVSHDGHIASLTKLARVIHQNNTKAFLQIYHGGAMTQFLKGKETHVCVSPNSQQMQEDKEFIELTEEMIQDIFVQYEKAVVRAIKAGFDGVELHAANSYLPNQFLMKSWNRREDKYGGSIQGRLLFLEELITRCQAVINKEAKQPFALGVRLSTQDMFVTDKKIREEMLKETVYVFNRLNELHLDYIHLATSNALEVVEIDGHELSLLQLLKEAAPDTLLVGNGNLLEIDDINEALKMSDMVSACRPFVLLPNWASYLLKGQESTLPSGDEVDFKETRYLTDNLWNSFLASKDWYLYSNN